eukprot:scaffold167_cov168-Ochromonas_danica.AAC.9
MAPDYMLTVWDWEDELMGLHSKAFGQDVWNVRFSDDDMGRLTTSGIGHIRFWKMASTFTGLKLQGYIGKFGKVDLSDIEHFVELPDGKVVSGTEEGSLLLWEGNFIKCRFTLADGKPCHKGMITFITFDRSEKCIISASLDGLIRWWDFTAIDTAEVDSDHSMDFELTPIAEYSPAGGVGIKAMAECKGLGMNRLFVAIDISGHAHSIAFTLLEDPLAAKKRRKSRAQLRICDALVLLQEKEKDRLERSPDGGGEELEIAVIDKQELALEKHTFNHYHAGAITGMDCCPLDHIVATCGSDGVVRCIDYVYRKEIATRSFDCPATTLKWLDTSLDALASSFIVGFEDGIVRVLSIGRALTGRLAILRRVAFKPHNAALVDISFSESGRYVATSGKDGIIFFLRCKPLEGDEMAELEPLRFVSVTAMAGKADVYCQRIAWSPNEKYILASCSDGVVREIDLSALLGFSLQLSEEEEKVTYEIDLPYREVQTTITVLPADKSGIFKLYREDSVISEANVQPPSAGDATTSGNGGTNASNAGESAPAGTATTGTDSPSKLSKTNTADLNAKPVPSNQVLKLANAIYARNRLPSTFLGAASLSANQHLLIEGDLSNSDHCQELVTGLYSMDNKDFLRPPQVVSMRYSWSKKFLLVGLSDGHVLVRPTDHLLVFARSMAHNSSMRGASLLAQSFDDRFLLSAGSDGMLVVHRNRLDFIQQRADSLFKDIDAGVFGREIVKAPPVGGSGVLAEPRYLSFVSGVHASGEDTLFDPALTAKKPEPLFEKELFNPAEEATDLQSGAYSIQDNRLKMEENAKRSAADELKNRVRASVRALRKDYEKILKENETIPENVRLKPIELEVDGEFFSLLRKKGQDMLEEVHRECAYESEKAEQQLEKIKNRLMSGLLIEEMPLFAFDLISHGADGQAIVRRQPKSMVLSLRAASLDPTVTDVIKEVKNEVHRRELQESRQRSNELAQKRAMEAMDEMKSRLLKKDEEGGGGNNNKVESNIGSADKQASDQPHESTAVIRRKLRKERKEELSKHSAEKPNENDDDIRDIEAIQLAERTVGDYKLKCADDYEVPEDQRINVIKKVRQMAMLEESMLAIRLQFNDRFLALRQLKRDIIYSVHRDNKRIREIDAELKQEELSLHLWEPNIDPSEYPDDYEEVTEDELKEFIKATEKSTWKDAQAPPARIVTGSKTTIVKNNKTGSLEVRKQSKNIKPVREYRDQLGSFLSDPSIMKVTPERMDAPKFYEVEEALFSPFLKNSSSEEAKKVRDLEEKVPSLRFIKSLLKQRTQSMQVTYAQKKINAQRRRDLEFERSMTLKKIEDNVSSFREAVDELRLDRHKVLADLKLAELKLLTLYQEYKLLQTFEARDTALQQKQVRCKGEESEILALSLENKARLEGKQEEIQHWNDKVTQIATEFKSLLPESHPYLETLTKIFRKKIKRNKGGGDDNEDEDEEEEEEEDEDEDDEEVEDICPPGCDQIVFEKILDLREKKLDTEEVCTEIQKSIDDLKRTADRLKQREKQIAKEAQQTELEVRQFQLQKQTALNQIRIVVPLQLSQIYMFETSGCLTGPTDRPIQIDEDLSRKIALIKDAEKRALVPQVDMKSHTLFSKRNLLRLQERITELHQEIEEAKEGFSLLHKERANLLKDHESKQGETESWIARCRDLQMLKFGREIDLDELEARSDRTKELEMEQIVAEERAKFEKENARLMKDVLAAQEKLAQVTVENTKLLEEVSRLTELKMTIAQELNAPTQTVQPPSALDDYKDAEERKRIASYVKFQATELEALRLELNMLKRKEAPIFSYTAPSLPAPQLGLSSIDSQKKSSDFVLPPIPKASGKN